MEVFFISVSIFSFSIFEIKRLLTKSIKDLKVFVEYTGPIKAPIKKDQEIGTLIIESSEEDENRKIPLYAKEKVKKVNFLKSLFMSFNYMIWGDA